MSDEDKTEKTAEETQVEDDERKVAELRAQHGPVASLRLAGHLLVFQIPSPEQWARFQDSLGGSKGSRTSSVKIFLLACRVYPEESDMAAALRAMPGALFPLADAIGELAGDEVEVNLSKG